MKKLTTWLIVMVFGFSLMLFSYFNYQHDAEPNPWKEGIIYVGGAEPNSVAEGLPYVRASVYVLPANDRTRALGQMAKAYGPEAEKSYLLQFCEKVISFAKKPDDLTSQMLEWGRLPLPGADEALAGFQTANREGIVLYGGEYNVVGGLKREARLFAGSYLVFGDSAHGAFGPDDEAVENAYVLQLSRKAMFDSQMRKKLAEAFPRPQFVPYVPWIRTRAGPYYLYVAGMATLMLGGTFLFFNIYVLLAGRLRNKWLRLPLAEVAKYKHLFLCIHLIYFGAVLFFALVAYHLPELQVSLLTGVRSGLTNESNPLAIAVKAYESRNMLRAAVTTFAVNFPIASLACITIPSVILPGVGVLVAVLRAALWGLLLAPSTIQLSGMMLPHSFTLLLEGEAYILATFFALLIFVYLVRPAEGPNVLTRYGRALLMNVMGNIIVAILLVIAAIYEAVELILAMS